MRFLRQNTAVVVSVGPILDKADGLTPKDTLTETGITGAIAYDADDGDALTHFNFTCSASAGDNDIVAIGHCGIWGLELTAAQTNYTGRMLLSLIDADVICPVFHEFTVLTANVYDSLFAGHGITADYLDVNVLQYAGATADHTTDGIPNVNVTQWLGTAAHAATVNGIPVVQLHGTGSVGVDAPSNFEDLAIVDSTGLVSIVTNQAVNVAQWAGTNVHAATTAGIPIVHLHDPGVGGGGLDAPLNFNDLAIVDTNGYVTFANTSIATVGSATLAASQHVIVDSGSVTVAGYATNQDPLTLVTGGANTLTVNTSHQALVDKTGYTLSVTPPTGAEVAALILATPSQKLVTDASGYVTYANAAPPTAADIADAVLDEALGTHAGWLTTLSTATELAKVKGAVAGKQVVNADGTQIKFYDYAGSLLSTLDLSGTTWGVTWA
jgi:hypothetical protein